MNKSEYHFVFPITQDTKNYRLYGCRSALIENTGNATCTINGAYPLGEGKNIELNPYNGVIDVILNFEFSTGDTPRINIIIPKLSGSTICCPISFHEVFFA